MHVVFSGRLTQQDDTTIVQADLASAKDGAQIWGERYTRTLANLPALQESIAEDILQQLRLTLTGTNNSVLPDETRTMRPRTDCSSRDGFIRVGSLSTASGAGST